MTTFTLTINADNAAFCDENGDPDQYARGAEVARILRHVAEGVDQGFLAIYLNDINGNRVGYAEFDEADHKTKRKNNTRRKQP